MNAPGLRYCTSCGSTLDPIVTTSNVAPVPRMLEPAPVAPPPAPAYGAPPAPQPSPYGANPYGPNPVPALGATIADPGGPPAFDRSSSPSFGGQPAPMLASPPAPAPIAPMRVVDLGEAGRPNGTPRPAEGPRMCLRCRGVVDGGAQFCKFCGAPLNDAPPAGAPAPAPPPVVSPAAGSEPLMAHERLSLPRTSAASPAAQPAAAASAPPAAVHRAPTVPMPAKELLDFQTPHGEFEPIAPPKPSSKGPPPLPAEVVAPPPAPVPVTAPAAPEPGKKAQIRGRLVVIAKSGADGPSYPFGDVLDVGRTEGQIIVGEDPYLSPRHVRIVWTGGKLVLRDLASTNGVFLRLNAARDMYGGRKSDGGSVPSETAVPLRDQDLILVGQQVLRFDITRQGGGSDAGLGPAAEHGTLLFGSPAAPRYARLSQRTVEGVTRDVYYLRKVETVLGRESGDVVFTEDPFLSRRHAAIRALAPDGNPLPVGLKPSSGDAHAHAPWALVDLGSSNGSFLRVRTDIDLVPGDHFRVGQQLFRVDFDVAQPG